MAEYTAAEQAKAAAERRKLIRLGMAPQTLKMQDDHGTLRKRVRALGCPG